MDCLIKVNGKSRTDALNLRASELRAAAKSLAATAGVDQSVAAQVKSFEDQATEAEINARVPDSSFRITPPGAIGPSG